MKMKLPKKTNIQKKEEKRIKKINQTDYNIPEDIRKGKKINWLKRSVPMGWSFRISNGSSHLLYDSEDEPY